MRDDLALAQAMRSAPQATVPDYAAGFAPRVEADGRLFLIGDLAGARVYVQPKAWETMRFTPTDAAAARPDAGAAGLNLFAAQTGVQLPQLQAHAGRLDTNDPAFGQSLIAAQTECGPRSTKPVAGTLETIHVVILAVGIVAAALIVRFKRSSPQ